MLCNTVPVKLTVWAREQGVSYRAALNWFHAGTLPVPARQLPSGTILVDPPARSAGVVAAYCRVSSHDQKADLERQAGRVLTACSQRGIRIDRTVTEIGSGLNGRGTKLRKLLADPAVTTIVVEHRDRLARFGVEYLESSLAAHGRTVVVLDDAELAEDLAGDLTEVLTSMCARLYGRGCAARRARAAVVAIENVPGDGR
jgi:putative resolvase